MYFLRLCTLLSLSEDAGLALLPMRRDPWAYDENAGPDWAGFQGYFANTGEVDHFVDGFQAKQTTAST